jgi:glycosyltransferase involved in cell wall biosynthesis
MTLLRTQMLDHITPVILTFNEEPNIKRTLSALSWAKQIIVVDSGSTDSTLPILAEDPRITVFSRKFDSHGAQWKFAITETNVCTDWVLRLDADYLLTRELRDELAQLDPNAPVSAYSIAFDYAIYGQRLRGSLYPAKPVLFRRAHASCIDRGHTEVWTIEGRIAELKGRILHDDHKRVTNWITAQSRYVTREFSDLERDKAPSLTRALRLRPPIMPFFSFLYCLFFKGLIFDGRAGLFYSLQRLLVETALALMVLEDRLQSQTDSTAPDPK